MMSLLLIPIGIALNFALGATAKALNLPIFLDSVGTILAAVLGGPIVGGITGLLGVLAISSFAPTAVVWSIAGGLIGVVAGLLARFGWFRGVKVVLATLVIILLAVTLSAVISIAVFGGFDGYGISVIRAGLVEAGFSMPVAVVLTSAVAELIDKSLSVLVPMLVVAAMSDRFLNKFPNGRFLRHLKTVPATGAATRRGAVDVHRDATSTAVADDADDATDGEYGSYGSYGDKN